MEVRVSGMPKRASRSKPRSLGESYLFSSQNLNGNSDWDETKSVSIRIKNRTQRRTFLSPYRSLRSEWRFGLSCVRARSLHNDRAVYLLGRYVATRFCAGCFAATLFVSFSDFSWMCFLRKILRKNKSFLRFIFRKNVHVDFYGLSDIDSAVTDFDPNSG